MAFIISFGVLGESYAATNQGAISGILNAAIDPSTIPTTVSPGSVSGVVCSIRLLMCGKLELVIVSTAIFMMGLLIMAKKLKWPYAIVMITAIVIFIRPQALVDVILSDFMGIHIEPLAWFAHICTCTLVNQIPWF